ncbi:MAG: flavanone 3-dioxygenase [Acidimicrobiaceae bacterium]|nr:flavanone 3-dioxygenase [Acidimicrobiaceae bacterium]
MAIATFSLSELAEAARGSSDSEPLLRELDAALVDPGAFRLTDLPVSDELLEELQATTRAFFSLPMDTKATFRFVEDQYVGWCGGEYLSQYGSADRKEMYHVGPRVAPTLAAHAKDGSLPAADADVVAHALASCSLWPDQPVAFIPVWHAYYAAMQEAAAVFGGVLARLLQIAPDTWFDTMQGNWADLAANYYPPIGEADRSAEAPVYNAAHSDLTVFTILYQDQSRAGGLSVESADGSWTMVEPVPHSYVVNVGELLTYLSGGRWRAAPHQVTVSEEAPTSARLSVPFFYRPSDERIVTSFVDPEAPPIAVGDWVIERKRRARAVPD